MVNHGESLKSATKCYRFAGMVRNIEGNEESLVGLVITGRLVKSPAGPVPVVDGSGNEQQWHN